MFSHDVSLPVWVLLLLLITTTLLLLDRIFIPGLKWILRRRVNRVIQEINVKLDIEIRPFQLTRRTALIDQLLFDEKVSQHIIEYAKEKQMPREVAQSIARRYASEIVPSFNAYMYFRVGYWFAKRIARMIYRVRVGFFDNNAMSKISSHDTVIFVMNHRSNMDYILTSFLVAEKTALSYAVGEWAKIWPLQTLIKTMGAFFVRRNSGNALYRKVLERYVHMATTAGVCQAVFLEGGLSKDGELREARLGFLDYILRGFHSENERDIVFVPVGINYDRVIEDRSLLRKLDKNSEKRSLWFVLKTSIGFAFKNILLSRRNRLHRFGYASVNFGKPVSTRQFTQSKQIEFRKLSRDERFEYVNLLATSLMENIRDVIPILPVAVMSSVILDNQGEWKNHLVLLSDAIKKIEKMQTQGAPINISTIAYETVLTRAIIMLKARKILEERDGLLRAYVHSTNILAYYANSIKHWTSQ